METGKMINRLSNRLRRRSQQVQEALGITGSQGMILDYILIESATHAIYQKDIEQEFGLRPSTATEVLKTLEKKELICREPDTHDARMKRIVFTEKATEIQKQLREEISQTEALLLSGISPAEQEEFLRLTRKMLSNLDQMWNTSDRQPFSDAQDK